MLLPIMAIFLAMALQPSHNVNTFSDCYNNVFLLTTLAIAGLGAAFNFGTDLATVLGIVAVVQAGNIVDETWSIGGPYSASSILGVLGGNPKGISYSHNRYEADASVTRVGPPLFLTFHILILSV
jgi:hypothetical protein